MLESDCYGQDWRVGDESIEVALQDEKMEDETVKVYCTRTAGTVRSIWKKGEAPPSEQNLLLKACGERWCGVAKKKCCTYDLETCVCLEKHGVVEKHNSNEYESGSWQCHKVEAQMEVAQSRLRVGQNCVGMVRRRRALFTGKKMPR